MKKKQNTFLRILAAVLFLLTLVEGVFHYADSASYGLLKAMMILQNAFKAFLMSPSISIQDVMKDLQDGATLVESIVAYAYSAAVFIAPFCTAAAVFNAISYLLRRRITATVNKDAEAIFIFGWNEDIQLLLKNRKNRQAAAAKRDKRRWPETIHIITAASVPEETEMRLLQEAVFFHREECLLLPPEKLKAFLEKLDIERAAGVILFEASSPANLSLYWAIRECGAALKPGTDFYLCCDHESTRRVIEDCDTGASLPGNLKLFSIPELKTRRIYNEKPLYTYNISGLAAGETPNWDVHQLIVGFGSIGRQVLRQTVQLGVMGSDNEILIDVVDKNADEQKSFFESHFHEDCLDRSAPENELRICSPVSDGRLRIRFHQLDIRQNGFMKKLRELSGELPFTYVAICTQDADVTMHCMAEVESFLRRHQLPGKNTPVAVRFEFERQIAEHLKGDRERFQDVFPIGANQDVLTLENILDHKTERECHAFNTMYDRIYETVIEQKKKLLLASSAEELSTVADSWDRLPYYKKEANRSLSYHGRVKKLLLAAREWQLSGTDASFEDYLKHSAPDPREAAIGILEAARAADGSFVISDAMFSADGRDALTEQAMLEHRRWCYSMLLDGWSYTPGKKDESRRITPYLCDWSTLHSTQPAVCANDLIPLMTVIWLPEEQEETLLPRD